MTKARDLANSADVFDTVSTTELGYLDGVTSAVQTQLDGKVASSSVDAKGDLLVGSADNTLSRLAVGSNGDTLVADSAATTGLRWQGNYSAGKNLIINGAMDIDQRNSASSAVSLPDGAANYYFATDRWLGGRAAGGTATLGQSSTAPTGFAKSVLWTNGTGITPASGDFAYLSQLIEGNNVAFLAYGTASAATLTLSFWVRSSLTGTFSASLYNTTGNKSYVFTYSISSANTWEKKSVTITGDTAAATATGTGRGLSIYFDMGSGSSNRTSTTSSWVSGFFTGSTGSVQTNTTGSSTFYLTGVQLEVGSVATAFTRAGGTIQGELAACQRYYFRYYPGASGKSFGVVGQVYSTTAAFCVLTFPVELRIRPTAIEQSGTAADYRLTSSNLTETVCSAVPSYDGWTSSRAAVFYGTVASGLTAGSATVFGSSNSSGYLGWSAEL